MCRGLCTEHLQSLRSQIFQNFRNVNAPNWRWLSYHQFQCTTSILSSAQTPAKSDKLSKPTHLIQNISFLSNSSHRNGKSTSLNTEYSSGCLYLFCSILFDSFTGWNKDLGAILFCGFSFIFRCWIQFHFMIMHAWLMNTYPAGNVMWSIACVAVSVKRNRECPRLWCFGAHDTSSTIPTVISFISPEA